MQKPQHAVLERRAGTRSREHQSLGFGARERAFALGAKLFAREPQRIGRTFDGCPVHGMQDTWGRVHGQVKQECSVGNPR